MMVMFGLNIAKVQSLFNQIIRSLQAPPTVSVSVRGCEHSIQLLDDEHKYETMICHNVILN